MIYCNDHRYLIPIILYLSVDCFVPAHAGSVLSTQVDQIQLKQTMTITIWIISITGGPNTAETKDKNNKQIIITRASISIPAAT